MISNFPQDNLKPDSKSASMLLNVNLHILILFTILATFFFVYISQMTSQLFKEEMSNLIDDGIDSLRKTDTTGEMKNNIKAMPLSPLVEYYKNTPDKAQSTQNKWLFIITCVIIGILLIFFLMLVFVYKSLKVNVDFLEIIGENVILFSLVGCVEIGFFLLIARNYVPVLPSTISNTMVKRLEENF